MTERHIPFTLLRTPSWDPFRDWHQGSRLFDQSFGMPSLAEEFHAGFPSGSTHWPGYMRPSSAMAAAADMGAFMPSYQQQAMMQQPHSPMMGPMMMPHHSPMMAPGGPMMAQPAMMTHQNPMMGRALSRQLSSGMSEIKQTQDSWKVCLDVNHFSPEELVIKTLDGVVEITGKHEERRDEHGFVSRCFTRKYTLPASASVEKVTSTLSPEGMLTVEAPLSRHTVKASEISIPITMGTKIRTGVVKEAEDEEE